MARVKQGKGRRRSRHEWQGLLAKLAGSGLGVAAFCRREGISAASVYRWRGLLGSKMRLAGSASGNGAAARGEGGAVPMGEAPAFVDLGTLSGAGRSFELKLDLGAGLTLHLVRH